MFDTRLRQVTREGFSATPDLIEKKKVEIFDFLEKYLKLKCAETPYLKIKRSYIKKRLQRIVGSLPSELPIAIFQSEEQLEAWVALNLLLSLPETVPLSRQTFDLRRNRDLVLSLIEGHLDELNFMLFWESASRDSEAATCDLEKANRGCKVSDFIRVNPFGLKIIPQSFLRWIPFFLTQNPPELQEALLSGSSELAMPPDSIIVLTPRSPIQKVTCQVNPNTATFVVQINVSPPLMLVGHFLWISNKSSLVGPKETSDSSINEASSKKLTPKVLYLATHGACSGFLMESRSKEKGGSIKIYSATNRYDYINLGAKFANLLRKANYGKTNVVSRDSRELSAVEIHNQEGRFKVFFLKAS